MVMPPELTDLASRAQIYNGLVASGFAQVGTKVALDLGDDDVATATGEWQLRRDETLRQLEGLPVVPPHGAWSALLDSEAIGIAPAELSARLLDHKVAATPMTGWGGDVAARHLRFVFSNEPVDRLQLLGERVRAALG
jgi:aspartate/methionine/tyrosine aminotransferase